MGKKPCRKPSMGKKLNKAYPHSKRDSVPIAFGSFAVKKFNSLALHNGYQKGRQMQESALLLHTYHTLTGRGGTVMQRTFMEKVNHVLLTSDYMAMNASKMFC